ncbi:unnamed protein product, partial [Amoebophrya sp. A120]
RVVEVLPAGQEGEGSGKNPGRAAASGKDAGDGEKTANNSSADSGGNYTLGQPAHEDGFTTWRDFCALISRSPVLEKVLLGPASEGENGHLGGRNEGDFSTAGSSANTSFTTSKTSKAKAHGPLQPSDTRESDRLSATNNSSGVVLGPGGEYYHRGQQDRGPIPNDQEDRLSKTSSTANSKQEQLSGGAAASSTTSIGGGGSDGGKKSTAPTLLERAEVPMQHKNSA